MEYLTRTGEAYFAPSGDTAHRLYVKGCRDPEGLKLILGCLNHDLGVPDLSRMAKRQFIKPFFLGWTEKRVEYEVTVGEIVTHGYACGHWVYGHFPDIQAGKQQLAG